jgi:hypothetical protein
MKLILTQNELNEIYNFTSGLNNPGANKIFNAMFTENHAKMLDQNIDAQNRTLELNINEKISMIFLDAFVKNAPNISTIFSSNKVSLLCNAKNIFTKLSSDIRVAVSIATNVWKNR